MCGRTGEPARTWPGGEGCRPAGPLSPTAAIIHSVQESNSATVQRARLTHAGRICGICADIRAKKRAAELIAEGLSDQKIADQQTTSCPAISKLKSRPSSPPTTTAVTTRASTILPRPTSTSAQARPFDGTRKDQDDRPLPTVACSTDRTSPDSTDRCARTPKFLDPFSQNTDDGPKPASSIIRLPR